MKFSRTIKVILLRLGLGLCCLITAPAHTAEFAIGANLSTLGAGVSATLGLNDELNARVAYNRFTESDETTSNGIAYNVDLELEGTSLLLDWYAFGGTFRFTGGIVAHTSDIVGVARTTGSVNIGGTTFTSAQVGTLRGVVDFPSAAPYLGIGWGNPVSGEAGLSFAADIGVFYIGSADFDLNSSSGLVPEANIVAEEREVENDLDDLNFYPVLRVGLAYHF